MNVSVRPLGFPTVPNMPASQVCISIMPTCNPPNYQSYFNTLIWYMYGEVQIGFYR